jgi:rhodanese-related sulfurtransferase
MKHLITLISLITLLSTSLAQANSNEFPGRKEFPEVEIYSKQHLNSNFDQVLIIDTRSNYEFETIHINTSINIPVSSLDFAKQVKEVRKQSNKPIVFYCNGRTCYKSYKATAAAIKNNIQNVFAYDAGMFEWAKTYPDRTTLLGNSPINPEDLLSKSVLKSRLLSPEKFSEMAYEMGNKASIVDIRDVTQRANSIGYFVGMEHWISINRKEKIIKFLRKANKKNKTLLIYDAVGKQVRWLQYTLEKENIKNYFFMEKGADGFYNQIINVRR